jgi:MFS family permease
MEESNMIGEQDYYRRNFLCFVADWVGFVTGIAFISYTSVIPSFVDQLTDFAPLIGLASTIPNGVWLLPQLLAANYVANREKKKPWVMGMGLVGRPIYLLLGAFIFVVGGAHPVLLLGTFFLAELTFSTLDGVSSVAWFDILSRVIPAAKRGRFYATAQVSTGVLSMGAGAIVARVLGPSGPQFPYNYGVLFCFSSSLLLLALLCFSFVKEPAHKVQPGREPWRSFLPRLARLFREDRQFRLLNIVRLLMALAGLALPFYVVHATNVLGLGAQYIGLFVSAQVLGSLLASLAMGYMNERSGSRIVTQFTVLLGLLSPLLALAIHWRPPQGVLTPYIYGLVFLFIGANYSGYMQGFMNLVLELSPPQERSAYVGLYNTLGGTVVTAAPLLGGWLLEATSFPVLFSVAAMGTATSFVLSLKLREPRRI